MFAIGSIVIIVVIEVIVGIVGIVVFMDYLAPTGSRLVGINWDAPGLLYSRRGRLRTRTAPALWGYVLER